MFPFGKKNNIHTNICLLYALQRRFLNSKPCITRGFQFENLNYILRVFVDILVNLGDSGSQYFRLSTTWRSCYFITERNKKNVLFLLHELAICFFSFFSRGHFCWLRKTLCVFFVCFMFILFYIHLFHNCLTTHQCIHS